jgi:hypothetical protein
MIAPLAGTRAAAALGLAQPRSDTAKADCDRRDLGDADRLCAARAWLRPDTAAVPRYVVGALSVTALLIVLVDCGHLRADAWPRRADASADARGALGRFREARRVRAGELLR